MKLKMTIDECLEFSDECGRGMTIHEDSRGWRVVCMLLAEEVRRMRSDSAKDIADLTASLEASEGEERAARDEVKRMRNRIESLRGMLKTNAGWWYDLSDDDKCDACIEAAGDMEPQIITPNVELRGRPLADGPA